jgi:hypothetical protein
MTPAEALQILDQATAGMVATRADHELVAEALRTLGAHLGETAPPAEGD